MPRVCFYSRRFQLPRRPGNPAKKPFLHEDNAREDIQCPSRGHLVGGANFADTLKRQSNRGSHNRERDDGGCYGLGLAVAVRVLVIRRFRGDAKSKPHNQRSKNIEQRFDAIRDEGVGVAKDPTENLDHRESRVCQHAGEREARAEGVCGLGSFQHPGQRKARMEKVSAIVIHEHGDPATVARCELQDLAPPGPGEVRVRMQFAPINPADMNVLEGKYPIRPQLPGVPGVEGVGVVELRGPGVEDPVPSTPVLLPHRFGSWREAGNVLATEVIPVPADVLMEQAGMLRINPATALLLLRNFVQLQPGDWVVQNAANSAVGRCVIGLARHYGWRTVNIVRREGMERELQSIGADVVLVESEGVKDQIHESTAGAAIRLALNAVGGESAVRLAGALAPGATVVTYGAMGRQPLRIPNGMLIFQDLAWRGFWVTRWFEQASEAERTSVFAELFALARSGVIRTPIEAVYPLRDIKQALEHAAQPMRAGKILLRGS
jgi:mitochondrial enoyl-[acyl-carrier protein] reductase / trans-2-enoyl-CoA reductase